MDVMTAVPSETELSDLGFNAAVAQLKVDKELGRKLRIAFEHFRVVEPQHIARFNTALREKTQKIDMMYGSPTFDRLAFTPVAQYRNVPPADVLQKLREAKTLACFDTFEIATIESVKVIPDPILFGRINGSGNRYFIAQWDDDVKIEDILREDEG